MNGPIVTRATWYRRRGPAVFLAIAVVLTVILFLLRGEPGGPQEEPPAKKAAAADGMAGMDMSSDGTVALSPVQQREMGVTYGTVEMRELSTGVRTVGTVMVNESRLEKVTSRFAGYVERLHVNFVGQPVRRGQPLATVFSPEILAAEQELLIARRLSRSVTAGTVPGVPGSTVDLVAAARQRLRSWDVSDAEINSVLRANRPSRTVTLRAPASGVVLEKSIVQGQAIQPGQDLYLIADLSDVWVDAQLREADAVTVTVGTRATLEFPAFPGRGFAGRVTFVYPTIGDVSRTARARIVVANPGAMLKPGMYATVRMSTSGQSALTVPRSALIETGERSLVFVDMGSGKLMPHEVTTGRRGSEYVEILSGVERGQRVVTSPQFLLDSESSIGELMQGMAAPTDKGADMSGMPGMAPTPKRQR